MSQKAAHCHKHIAKVAREAAAASYDELMSDNMLYSAWKRKNPRLVTDPKRLKQKFVNDKWGLYVAFARATLGLLLREPIDDKVKEEIVEILALDSPP